MNKIQQKQNSNQSYVKKIKKLGRKINIDKEIMSISSIEHLSNEIFYEIFDYLDGIDIYEAFSNLNSHFQQLFNSSSLLLKIKLGSSTSDQIFMKNYQQILLHNKSQIFSINVWLPALNNQFFTLFPIDLSFNHLKSLIIERLEPNIFNSFLTNLAYLSCLSSLTIKMRKRLKNLNGIYQLIFALPTLRYNKLSLIDDQSSISLPMATNNKQLSTIEHLIINHSCKFNELFAILSYTSQLRRLNFRDTDDDDTNIGIMLPITLLNFTHLSLRIYSTTFDNFEIFIRKIYSKLKFLHVIIRSDNIDYLDANRWQQLILQYLPQLEKFYFDYYIVFEDDIEPSIYIGESNQFSSSFWIDRQWIFESKIRMYEIIYSIRPYTKKWYEYVQHEIINSSIQLFQSAQLELTFIFYGAELKFLISNINLVLTVADIYHLNISDRTISVGVLIQIIYFLPKLISLKICSLSFSQSRNLSKKQIERFLQISERSKITKVYFETTNDIEEVYFLMLLCPHMNYLQINSINNINIKLFIRNILIKINNNCNEYLRLLFIHIPTADNQMIIELKKMISMKKLLVDYEIKRVVDHIYLQWR
ncbi:unnamed protein product [Rotaria sordida]|uniref:F-box domain-containing protein n=1 Tax=Rotaria sordida TaxID=392033 RepID=A0A815FPJ8_9BILA|nr:unnamed protein product [Rotaria sordida]